MSTYELPAAPVTRRLPREAAWTVLACLAAGAAAGLLVGGVGGRLAMLLLRLTSPDTVLATTTDDGFLVGVVSTDTLGLIAATTLLGGLNGVLYAILRPAIPVRARLALWSLFAALVGGAQFVHPEGADFRLLEPAWLGIALFVALPGLAAALVVVLAERWLAAPPWADRRRAAALAVLAAAATFAAAPAAAAVAGFAALERAPRLRRTLRRVASVAVPGLLVLGAADQCVDLVRETATILGD
jgi:hypothetical protein